MKEQSSLGSTLVKKLTGNLAATIVVGTTLVLAVVIGVEGGPSQVINSIVTGGMWALLAVGLALVFGVMNVPHFAHGESFMVGAYVAYFVFNPIHTSLKENPNTFLGVTAPFLAMLAAAVAGLILGVILERLLFYPLRLKTKSGWVMNAFLLTVGISFILTNGTTLTLGPNFRGIPRYWDVPPLQVGSVRVAVDRIIAFFIAIISIVALWFFLRQTRTGRAIRAVSQDELGAQMMGINLNFIYPLTFALATAMAALSGASLLFMFQAYPTVGLKPLYFAWYVVMLAGLGNVVGAIVGGFIVAVLQSATQLFTFTVTVLGHEFQIGGIAWEDVIPTFVMIIVLLVVPSGIFGSEVKGVQEQ
ncbi:MAG TPA: branched-chain amino acid ABC transporter permease [Chloroflexi bacterium]|nr:branched-chain amino acid ABC transporter permease [Chloroflexota bacterium]